VYRSELCLFASPRDVRFRNEQFEKGSDVGGKHVDVFPPCLMLFGHAFVRTFYECWSDCVETRQGIMTNLIPEMWLETNCHLECGRDEGQEGVHCLLGESGGPWLTQHPSKVSHFSVVYSLSG
jgi:hypothetical protein